MISGVQMKAGSDGLGQNYLTPETVILNKQCDAIIVGRGITQAEDPAKAAKEYQEAAYKAYLSRL